MASLSQALRLGDLPPPHRTFQGHATHIREWSMMLRPNDSWSTCIPQGIATFLHYASRRSAGHRYTAHDYTARCKPVLLPMPPPRKRSRAPTAFAGLTHKPHCVACEQDATHPIPPLPTPPKSMPSTHRRPRIVDTSMHFCPHAGCDYRGWLGLGTEA